MTRRTITETIEEYNTNGNLIRKVTTITKEEEDAPQNPLIPIMPTTHPWTYPWTTTNPEVTYSTETGIKENKS